VHHALINIIEPIFEPTFITDSYANRKGKGTHKGVDRCQEFCRKNRFVLKCDISKYFPSIDHELLKQIIRQKIADPDVLWLIDILIDASNEQEPIYPYFPGDDLWTPYTRRKGIPIGNLTSQFFANLYLNDFDHFVKQELRCQYYLRYVDDFACFDDHKDFLHEVKDQMSEYLERLRVKLHPKKSRIFPVWLGVPFLGYKVYPYHRKLCKKNSMIFRGRLRKYRDQYRAGKKEFEDISRSVRCWVAHASHANTYRLRETIFSEVDFYRGPG
ncbi:MAG: RNA-directed DNA polymerase, partial [Nitrospira sp.]|nr:RNA-directed DNA polymerase [Nitrospira sp.]